MKELLSNSIEVCGLMAIDNFARIACLLSRLAIWILSDCFKLNFR